ncbi:MAG: histidine kinase [Proteobacteria bacterium]|nr:MAG: histidine kinase [Pseudomonadota bacterium]
MLVKDLMVPKEKLVTIDPLANIREALKVMRTNHVKSLVVERSNDHDAYGMLTFKNILYSIVASDGDIDLLRVYDLYSKPTIQLSGELDVKYAAQMMMKSSIKRILVIDNNQLQGILTMSDILEAVMAKLDK